MRTTTTTNGHSTNGHTNGRPRGHATPVTPGFNRLLCPRCNQETNVALWLDDLRTVHCGMCREDIEIDDVRKLVAGWQRVLAWLDAMNDSPND